MTWICIFPEITTQLIKSCVCTHQIEVLCIQILRELFIYTSAKMYIVSVLYTETNIL